MAYVLLQASVCVLIFECEDDTCDPASVQHTFCTDFASVMMNWPYSSSLVNKDSYLQDA